MTGIAVERIKLFSTRSPYWCLLLIVVATFGFATLMGLVESGEDASIFTSQIGVSLGTMIFMVLAALAVTTEYRFGTIRNTFLAVPQRAKVLVSKTVLLAVMGAVVGFVAAVGAFYLTKTLASAPEQPLELATSADWRLVAGHSAIFAISAVIAVSVGTLVRQSAGAIAILLLWPLLLENILSAVPGIRDIAPWLPYTAGQRFVQPEGQIFDQVMPDGPTPIQGLAVYAGLALVLWIAALLVLRSRDA